MGKSSKDKRDAYYRLAKEQGWRARSAFKLLQLDEVFDLFHDVECVVDLCAAPGSWSQVLSRVLVKNERIGRAAWEHRRGALPSQQNCGEIVHVEATTTHRRNVRIVAIDLQPMSPLEGITCLKADITHPSTVPLLVETLSSCSDGPVNLRPVDLVLSDGAPDVTGLHDLDSYVQSQLLWAALRLALHVLRPGGRFVAKIFRSKDVDILYAQLKLVFRQVTVAKPRSSRASSVEAFVVCFEFLPENLQHDSGLPGQDMPNPVATTLSHLFEATQTSTRIETTAGEKGTEFAHVAPFLACGDLSAFDADASHRLPLDHISLDPIQYPTAPPYKRALQERRRLGGGEEKGHSKQG